MASKLFSQTLPLPISFSVYVSLENSLSNSVQSHTTWLLLWKTFQRLLSHSSRSQSLTMATNVLQGFPGGSVVKNPPVNPGDTVWFLDQGDPLEEEKTTHSSIFAWIIPQTEEHSGLQSMGSHRIRHNWAAEHTLTNVFHHLTPGSFLSLSPNTNSLPLLQPYRSFCQASVCLQDTELAFTSGWSSSSNSPKSPSLTSIKAWLKQSLFR